MRQLYFALFPYFIIAFSCGGQSRNDWQKLAFDGPLIPSRLYFDSINSLKSLDSFLTNKFPFQDKDFFSCYRNIRLIKSSLINDTLFRLSIGIKKKEAESFSYFKKGRTNSNVAFLMIPGSMDNQSFDIYRGNRNYHNEYDNVFLLNSELGDSYLYIKPNEDILAIHDGKRKLSNLGLVPTLLNKGRSYTANYFIQIVGIIKWLQKKYSKVIVVGLSQGGFAGLITSLSSKPDGVVVASGYSVLFHELFYVGINQPISSDLMSFFSKSYIKERIVKNNTKYLFSWEDGQNAVYNYENRFLETFNFLKDSNKVEYYNLNKGHTFPQGDILRSFYTKIIQD